MTSDRQLSSVRLVGVPLELREQARVWFEGLLREFDVLAADTGEGTPRELLEFVNDARQRFSQFAERSNEALDEAYGRGERSADVVLEVPPEAGQVARQMWDHIQHAETYCRKGDLLTLTPNEEVRRYLHWYLTEVADQVEGELPRPWDPQPPTK